MIALAMSLMALAQWPAAEPSLPQELVTYYFCAANRADAIAGEDRSGARPAEQIADLAIAACADHRGPALEAAMRLLLADPRVQLWAREENLDETELRHRGLAGFEEAMRARVVANIAEGRTRAGE